MPAPLVTRNTSLIDYLHQIKGLNIPRLLCGGITVAEAVLAELTAERSAGADL